jgi:RimJ/RimL family protein N-acetyltransferase
MPLAMQLVAIAPSGAPEMELRPLPAAIEEALSQTRSLYEREGYAKPWISYVGVEAGQIVALGAFKSAPVEGRVEIAYMTAPEFEGRGFATTVARDLIALARGAVPGIDIRAQTLPQKNASVAILKKLGFQFAGDVQHPEDGLVWEWSLPHLNPQS